jgi:VWFA-related protein
MNAGPDSAFAQIDFAQLYMGTANREQQKNVEQKAQRQHLVDIGLVSALDLDASDKAVGEFNQAVTLLKAQNSKQAILHLQKAIVAYPKFVLAYNTLGLAYLDQQDPRAQGEFETAAKLDPKFPGTFLNLGTLALSADDFARADANIEKAAALNPKDAKILAALAFAQNGEHKYAETLQTVERVHALGDRGMANVHYIGAAAAMSLQDYDAMQRELSTFLAEDPTNPLAPVARQNLDALTKRKAQMALSADAASVQQASAAPHDRVQTFPNTERLKSQLNAMQNEPETGACETCTTPPEPSPSGPEATSERASISPAPATRSDLFTIHQVVDETALFFAVSHHGRMIDDLSVSDIQILDDNKPPNRILQFVPQSKLPLRLGLLIDTSGSVQGRFSFEKHAAEKFLEKVLNVESDLAFVGGFSTEVSVTQDFTANPDALGKGVEKLTNGGGTSLFDAVSLACWKLAAYPEDSRVAKVLVILTDGEDNSSHRSLKQSVEEAEAKGVTIYTVSTSESIRAETDADRVLQLLAERSGGEAMFPGDLHALDTHLSRLRDLIRSRYLIAYKPADFAPDGKYRTVHIVAEKDGQHLQVHSRKGYYARHAEAQN